MEPGSDVANGASTSAIWTQLHHPRDCRNYRFPDKKFLRRSNKIVAKGLPFTLKARCQLKKIAEQAANKVKPWLEARLDLSDTKGLAGHLPNLLFHDDR